MWNKQTGIAVPGIAVPDIAAARIVLPQEALCAF